MGTNLYWRQIPKDQKPFGYQLKWALAPYLWEHDGSLTTGWTTVDCQLIPFLRGVVAASNNDDAKKEAEELIDLIEKYEEVQICLS